MNNIDISLIGKRWKGNYNATTVYKEGDVVYKDAIAQVYTNGAFQSFAEGQQDILPNQIGSKNGGISAGLERSALTMGNFTAKPSFKHIGARTATKVIKLADTSSKGTNTVGSGNEGPACMSAIMDDNTVRVWGTGEAMGTGDNSPSALPKRVAFPRGTPEIIDAVLLSNSNAYYIDIEGGLWSTGLANMTGTGNIHYTPQKVNGAPNQDIPADAVITKVTVAYGHADYRSASAIDSLGRVYFWATSAYYSGTDGVTGAYPKVAKASLKVPMKEAIIFGGSTFASGMIDYDGQLWVMGSSYLAGIPYYTADVEHKIWNPWGTARVKKYLPMEGFYSTAYYNGGLVLLENGDLYGFGHQVYNSLGGATPTNYSATTLNSTWPTYPARILTDVADVYGGQGYNRTIALKNDGTVWGCGYNGYYLFNTAGDTATFVQSYYPYTYEDNLNDIVEIKAWLPNQAGVLAAKKSSGQVIMTGLAGYGQLGNGFYDGSTGSQPLPKAVLLDKPIVDVQLAYGNTVANYKATSFFLTNDGEVYAAGFSGGKANGSPDEDNNAVPMQILF